MTQGFFLAPARGEGASLSAGLGGGPDRVDNLPVLRHGPMIAHILDTAITCSGPQDPRLFTLLENDQMAQVKDNYQVNMTISKRLKSDSRPNVVQDCLRKMIFFLGKK